MLGDDVEVSDISEGDHLALLSFSLEALVLLLFQNTAAATTSTPTARFLLSLSGGSTAMGDTTERTIGVDLAAVIDG